MKSKSRGDAGRWEMSWRWEIGWKSFGGLAEITHPPMITKSSPGSLTHDRTCELCRQSSVPTMLQELTFGYWNSPAAHTTYRAVSFSVAAFLPRAASPGVNSASPTPTLKLFAPSASTEIT